MTVAYVLDRFPELTQTFVSNEIAELERQGVDPLVVALHRGHGDGLVASPPAMWLREVKASRRDFVRAHLSCLRQRPVAYACFLLAIVRTWSERRDIAWRRLPWLATRLEDAGVSNLHAHFGWSGAAAAYALATLTGRPWSMTVHARDIFADARNLDTKLRRCDRVVTVCEANVKALRARGFTGAIDIVVCGVEVPATPAPCKRTVDVIAVGRLVEKKGFDVLAAAAARLRAQGRRVSVGIVGEGPLGADLGKDVDLVGALPHADVLARMSQAKLLAFPGRIAADGDVDAMPVVIKEAMALGLPIVATAVGGIPEIVDDSCGRLVPPDDPDALAAALDELLGDDRLRRTLGAAARQRVIEGFTLSGEVTKLRKIFDQLVQQQSRTRLDRTFDLPIRTVPRWRGRLYNRVAPRTFARGTRIGRGVRFENPSLIRVGRGVIVADGCLLAAKPESSRDGQPSLRIGAKTFFNIGAVVTAGTNSVDIGRDVMFGPHAVVVDADHEFDRGEVAVARQGLADRGPIRVGDGCWIASGAVILGGTTLASGCVVAANAVVRGHFPRRAVIGGVPARVIRFLDEACPPQEVTDAGLVHQDRSTRG